MPTSTRRADRRASSELRDRELEAGFVDIETYARLSEQVRADQAQAAAFLIDGQGAGQAHRAATARRARATRC